MFLPREVIFPFWCHSYNKKKKRQNVPSCNFYDLPKQREALGHPHDAETLSKKTPASFP